MQAIGGCQAGDQSGYEERHERRVFLVDEAIAKQQRLGCEQNRRHPGRSRSHEAQAQPVEAVHRKQEHQEVGEMMAIGLRPARGEPVDGFGRDVEEHEVDRAVIGQSVQLEIVVRPRIGPQCGGPLVGIPTLVEGCSVVVAKPDGDDQSDQQDHPDRRPRPLEDALPDSCHVALAYDGRDSTQFALQERFAGMGAQEQSNNAMMGPEL